MAYELQKLTPTHMLHAGRYSALGMDVASQVGLRRSAAAGIARARRLWQDWLPDIYLNPHGYPSHEWVQQFAGYVPPGFRTYWSTRGWYTQVSGLRDPRYPEHADAVAAIREAIVREINSNPDVRDMNLRHQARYRRWAYGFAPYVFSQEIYKDTAIYYTDHGDGRAARLRGAPARRRRRRRRPRFSMNHWPQVTFMSGMTESPDETAQGAWLDLVDQAGLLVPDGAHEISARRPLHGRADRRRRAARQHVAHAVAGRGPCGPQRGARPTAHVSLHDSEVLEYTSHRSHRDGGCSDGQRWRTFADMR